VSEIGTQQLSIDTDSVRRLLLDFPKAARPLDDPSEFASYAHHVEREMGAAINLVKVLQVCWCVGGGSLHPCPRPWVSLGFTLLVSAAVRRTSQHSISSKHSEQQPR
jgi:hypothetical protein